MTSPYLTHHAEKLRLVHPAPKPPTVGAHADHDPRDFHYPRTQREAGIEHQEWENRIPPMRPIWFFAISAACWIVLAVGIAWLAATFSG